jgi:tRNA A-37 threonylcarbamoyl transferase component Bud32
MMHRRREIICHPARKDSSKEKLWDVKTEVQLGKGKYSTILQACKNKDCDYVMKLVKYEFHERIENEVKMQKKCAKHGLCPPVIDWWLCPKSEDYGGVIISPLLDENLKDYLMEATCVNANNDKKRVWVTLKKSLVILVNLHKLKMIHGNVKLTHFMIDKKGSLFLVDMRYGRVFKKGEEKLIYNDYNSITRLEQNNHIDFDILRGIDHRIEDLVYEEGLDVLEAEEKVINNILRMSYKDTLDYSRKTRNRNPEFVGISQMKRNLLDMKGYNHGSLNKFKDWAYNSEWHKFDHINHEYDWWMFPINLPSSKGFKYTVYESDIQELLQDSSYVADYVLGVKLMIKSWGWNIKKGEMYSELEEGQGWKNWDVRLRKVALSLKLFRKKELFEDLKKFAIYLLKNDMLINPDERKEVTAIFKLDDDINFNRVFRRRKNNK